MISASLVAPIRTAKIIMIVLKQGFHCQKTGSLASISHHWLMLPYWAAQSNITDVESPTVYMIGKINSQMGQLVVCAEHGGCFWVQVTGSVEQDGRGLVGNE